MPIHHHSCNKPEAPATCSMQGSTGTPSTRQWHTVHRSSTEPMLGLGLSPIHSHACNKPEARATNVSRHSVNRTSYTEAAGGGPTQQQCYTVATRHSTIVYPSWPCSARDSCDGSGTQHHVYNVHSIQWCTIHGNIGNIAQHPWQHHQL